MTPEQQSNWLRVPGWLTAMLIGPVVSCCALAQAASPVTFVLPPAQQAQFGAVASDPTIRPFITPGVPAGVFLSWSVDLQGNGRPDSVLCHGTFPPDPKVKQPCRVLRPQLDGAVLDVTRKLFGNGALPSVEHPRGFVTGDFNGDGRADIFVAAHGYDTAPFDGEINLLLLSNPNGTYSDRSSTLPQEPDFSHSACAADVNGDGRLDIFVNNLDGPVVPGPYFLLGNGDGTFTQTRAGLPASIVRTVGSAPPDRSLACGFVDADGDGYPDLLLGAWGPVQSANSFIYFNDGTGDFIKRPRVTLPTGPLGATTTVHSISPLDIDRDGRPDLIVMSINNAPPPGLVEGFALQVLINKGGGAFADETAARLGIGPSVSRTTGPYCTFIRLADFNGDGWEDFYCNTNNWSNTEPCIWMNQRNGSWVGIATAALPPVLNCNGMNAVDFDADGRPDLMLAGSNQDADIFYGSYLNRTPRSMPSAPIIRPAIADDGRAAIFFTAPFGSGTSPITGYIATCSTGTAASVRQTSGASSPLIVTGLTNGKLYTCSVRTQTATGSGLASESVMVRPSAGLHTVIEFYNTALDHFFITANPVEQIAVASGSAGSSWSPTGVRFNAGGSSQVCRFYGSVSPGPNSHFYTIDPAECQALKELQAATPATQKRWNFESTDFSSAMASGGQCAAGMVPVYRAYNDGFVMGLDSNHRITSNASAYQAQVAKGWKGEGVVMCAPG